MNLPTEKNINFDGNNKFIKKIQSFENQKENIRIDIIEQEEQYEDDQFGQEEKSLDIFTFPPIQPLQTEESEPNTRLRFSKVHDKGKTFNISSPKQ